MYALFVRDVPFCVVQITKCQSQVALCHMIPFFFPTEIQSREERSRQYFETDLMLGDHCDEEDELYDRVGARLARCPPRTSTSVSWSYL